MKRAQDYLIECKGLFGSKYEMDYGLSDLMQIMMQYADQYREEAFREGFDKGNRNGSLNANDGPYNEEEKRKRYSHYKQSNPLL